MSFAEKAQHIHFTIQATAFESSSSGNQPFIVKEEVGYNFKKTFRKPNDLRLIEATTYALGVLLSHTLV